MTDRAQRKELLAQYKQAPPDAGVYAIRNTRTGRLLVGSAMNLNSVRSKLEFWRTTNTVSALDRRLHADAREIGPDAFAFEVLESLTIQPDATAEAMRSDLAVLEELWREKLDAELVY